MPRFPSLCLWSFSLALCTSGCLVTPTTPVGVAPRTATVVRPTLEPETKAAPDQPTEIAARHLLVQYQGAEGARPSITRSREEAQARAEEARARAAAKEPFEALVTEYSDEPGAAERGGALGRFGPNVMVRAFSDAAFQLSVGEISRVVESPYGFHVIERTE